VLAGRQKFHGGRVYILPLGILSLCRPIVPATGVAMAWKATEALANSVFLML
jgi:hypothetical protein